jgi:hypothetical protein
MAGRLYSKLSIAAALVCAVAAGPAAAQDAVHDQVQKFLNVLQGGGDFANSEFRDAVKSADVPRLKLLVDCDLGSVKHGEGGSSAIVLFSCPTAAGKTSTAVMILLSSGKAISIEPMSFVGVPERG